MAGTPGRKWSASAKARLRKRNAEKKLAQLNSSQGIDTKIADVKDTKLAYCMGYVAGSKRR